MTRNQKIFLLILGLYVIFDFVLNSLISIFIWQKTQNTTSIISYHIALFISILITSQFSARAVGKYGAKKIYSLSILFGIAQAVVVALLQQQLSSITTIVGLVAGASIGIQSVSYNIISSEITKNTSAQKYLGIKSAVMRLTSLAVVPLITYLISATNSYTTSFIAASVVGFAIIILSTKLKIEEVTSEYSPLTALSVIRKNKEGETYLKARFYYGVFNGLTWAILGVVTYMFTGDVLVWGIVSTIFTFISIAGSYLYGKLVNENAYKAISAFSTLIFGALVIVLTTNWNFTTFILYQVGLTLLNVAFSNHYEKSILDLMNNNLELSSYKKEIAGLGEVFINLGRIIPLVLLLFVGFSLNNDLWLRILFSAIATIPLIIISLLEKTHNKAYHYDILE